MNKNEENEEISKRQGQVKKKTKIKKTKEKSLRHVKIYFNNIPSIKSKIDSIQEIIEEEKPDIVGLVETHLEEHENIHFEDYIIIRRDRGSRGGGILIAIREKFKNLCIECKSQNEDSNLESIRILLGGRTKYKVGVIYAPQGNKLRIKELQEVYRGLKKEIEQRQAERKKKFSDWKRRDQGREHRSQQRRKRTAKAGQENEPENSQTEQARGIWTGQEKDKKSTIDFMLIEEEEKAWIESFIVDEERINIPYHMVKEETKQREVYSDYNAIICSRKWEKTWKKNKERKITMRKSYN
eukprot:gene6438-7168_t